MVAAIQARKYSSKVVHVGAGSRNSDIRLHGAGAKRNTCGFATLHITVSSIVGSDYQLLNSTRPGAGSLRRADG
jgi:hypothetical protein